MPYTIQTKIPSTSPQPLHFSARRFAEARHRRGLSRSQLHLELAMLGVKRCRALIDNWSRAISEPRASELAALSVILNVPMESFFEIEPVATE